LGLKFNGFKFFKALYSTNYRTFQLLLGGGGGGSNPIGFPGGGGGGGGGNSKGMHGKEYVYLK
jgi:hypothetical protein